MERVAGAAGCIIAVIAGCQFYDRRATAAENAAATERAAMELKAAPPPDTVSSDA